MAFNAKEIFTAFIVLFAVIDIVGSTPVIINLKNSGKEIHTEVAVIIALSIFISFLFLGDFLLQLFNIDVYSFAMAGALVLFVLAVEMIFNVEVFRNNASENSATIVPVVFPLIAGAGSLTTILSLRSECHVVNIVVAIVLNVLFIYLVLRNVSRVERLVGKGGIYVLRKFFGIILLAMAVKLFTSNLKILLASVVS